MTIPSFYEYILYASHLNVFDTHVTEKSLWTHTNIQSQTSDSHPPTHSLPHTLQANWESPLADLPSYTKRVITMTAESCSLFPTRVGLVRAQTARTHLADITANPSLCCQGNHNLATATWQRPTPQGIDWVSNAVRGGLGGVLLSPSMQRDTRGLSFARH